MRKRQYIPKDVYLQFQHLNDDGRLRYKFRSKRNAANQGRIGFTLTYSAYCQMLIDAGIKSSDISWTGYHLARYGDKGPYAVSNCRFVHYKINLAEIDSETRSRGLRRWYRTHDGSFAGRHHTEETKRKISAANSANRTGPLNSQYGRCWIFKNGRDKKINSGDLDAHLSKGWKRGRASSPKYLRKKGALLTSAPR